MIKQIILLVSIVISILQCSSEKNSVSVIDREWRETHFISLKEWEEVEVQKSLTFELKDKNIEANLKVTNDSNNLYMLFEIFNDDYFLGANDSGEWADDRLFIEFDDFADKKMNENSEDRLSIFVSDFHESNTNLLPQRASWGDWYFENDSLNWEWSKEADWEQDSLSGKPYELQYRKEVFFAHSGSFVNGEIDNYLIEIKIPFNSIDPFDLQSNIGDSIGFVIEYGNITDGYDWIPERKFVNPENGYGYADPKYFYTYNLK